MKTINPWESSSIEDYRKLFDEFGISPFDELLPHIKSPHRYMRRGIIFGHRSYDSILKAMYSGKPFSAMSGFMPSGRIHLGHKMVMEEIIWHQQQGGTVFMAVADMESHSVRGTSWKDCWRIGVEEYILSLIALGFEPEGGRIYFQSTSSDVRDMAFELGIKSNFSELSAIYGFNGETNIGHMVSATVQSADILHPQLEKFSGPKPVVIPVGADQDPHIRLTRGLADKMNMFHVFEENRTVKIYRKTATKEQFIDLEKKLKSEIKTLIEKRADMQFEDGIHILSHEQHLEIPVIDDQTIIGIRKSVNEFELGNGGYAFMPPASTYHKFMTGLQGGKMSSSIPESIIALTEEPEHASKKIMRAKTGGRVTLEEQKQHGGIPDECTVFELMLYHLIEDDNEVLEIKEECMGGKLMCGKCKKRAAALMEEFLYGHQQNREAAKERLPEFGISYRF
jgi:tryptophanyl-tRNA synthetase